MCYYNTLITSAYLNMFNPGKPDKLHLLIYKINIMKKI